MGPAKLNQGIYSFLKRCNISHDGMHQMLRIYAKEVLDRTITVKRHAKWYASISEKAGEDFTTFKKYFNKHRKQLKKAQRYQSYEDWYTERALDGSFAYNGSADDL